MSRIVINCTKTLLYRLLLRKVLCKSSGLNRIDPWHYHCVITSHKAMLDHHQIIYPHCYPKVPSCPNLGSKLLWLFFAVIVVLGACRSQPRASLPAELIGTWITDHPKYATLYFQVSPGSFAIATAEGTVETYTLTKYEPVETTVKKRKSITHVLHGTRPGQEKKLSLSYEASGGGFIRLSNRANIVWTRRNGSP